MKINVKFTVFIFITVFLFLGIWGCMKNTPIPKPPSVSEHPSETSVKIPPADPTAAPKEELNLGYAIISNHDGSRSSKRDDGVINTNMTIIALAVNDIDVITDCRIETVQTEIGFNNLGEIISGISDETSSGIEKESTVEFEKYVCGKTINEIKSSQVDNNEIREDPEMDNKLIEGVEEAVKNAKQAGTKINDKLGISVVTSNEKSKNAADSNTNGIAQTTYSYAVLTFDDNGRATACILECLQSFVEFDYLGNIVSDIDEQETWIDQEWQKNADSFAKYVSGKTLIEIKEIADSNGGILLEQNKSSYSAESISDFIALIDKAFESVK